MTALLDHVQRKKSRHPGGKVLLDTYGDYRVYLVDGDRVRNSSLAAQEFGESASHFTLPLVVPEGEIWIEDDVSAQERPFVISGALHIAHEKNYAAGIRYEKHERERAKLVDTDYHGKLLSEDCYVRDLGELPNGVKVRLVAGEKVRDETKVDFIEGGHDLVYKWLPPKTIILEAGLHAAELPIVLDHEATERRRMANGMKYLKAHEFSDKEEFTSRKHGAPSWAVELVTLGKCSDRSKADMAGDIHRTVYTASGPGIQADVSPAGNLAMAFGHCHQARVINLPTQYDQISGPEVLEPGVRVQWAMHPQTLDRQPVLVQFDSEKFTEDQARAWLSARNIREYTWQPDSRDQTPTTQGNPRAEGEKPPQGFSDLNSFYAATIPVESERAAAVTMADVVRTAGPHSYSSTQINLADPLKSKVLAAAGKIPDADLAEDGRETEPHITVLYGLQTDEAKDVAAIVTKYPDFRYTLGEVTIFEVNDKDSQRGGGDKYDVVKIDVESPELVALHALLAKLPHADTHPVYKPHVTLAYVKSGLGKQYVGMADFSRQLSAKASAVVFSNRADEKTTIPLEEAGT
jgi:hypothetical protein